MSPKMGTAARVYTFLGVLITILIVGIFKLNAAFSADRCEAFQSAYRAGVLQSSRAARTPLWHHVKDQVYEHASETTLSAEIELFFEVERVIEATPVPACGEFSR